MQAFGDEPLRAAEVEEWDRTADVVVVGQGIAGACAAIEASEAGTDVVVLERSSAGGGASCSSRRTRSQERPVCVKPWSRTSGAGTAAHDA